MPNSIPVAAAPAGNADAPRAAAGREPALASATGLLALAVEELPDLLRRMSGQPADAGQSSPAAGSFWFQMGVAADAATRLHLALDTARAALAEDGEDQ